MGAGGIAGACAVALAAGSGACMGSWLWSVGSARMDGASRLDLPARERAEALMRTASRPFRGVAAAVLRLAPAQVMADEVRACLQAEQRLDAETAMSMLLGASVILGLASLLLTSSPVFALAVACIVFLGMGLWAHRRTEKEAAHMRDEVPDTLRSLADSFRSGHSLLQTMEQASKDVKGKLGEAFGGVARRLEMGESTKEALRELRRVKGVPELAFVAVALDVQHQSGGSIAPVLESARESVEGELELARTLRVQTAQAKLSASIVTIMPFVLVAFFSLASPGFLSPFFESALGVMLLIVALIMQIAGVLSVRRICKVDS